MDDNKYYKANNAHSLPSWCFFMALFMCIVCGLISDFLFNSHFPKALENEVQNPNDFLGVRGFKLLEGLTQWVRVTGTYENEVLAYTFLMEEVKLIQKNANPSQFIETDSQIVSGSYEINFWGYDLANVYRNVQNIVVKLHGKSNSTSSLMFNCHFDSVPGSPGASDDAANCIVMIEVLRVLSKSSQRLKYSIIFLFNGAEETPLQASHGFITQHKWAKDIKTFINLESCGSGGKEMLFQAGPRNPWLIKMYSNVPHPSAQVAAEEIFQSGVIPSDTDFRIFRDFAKIPGLDFAHNRNGYRYHTKFDSIEFLTPEFLQRTGDNALTLARVIADSDDLELVEHQTRGDTIYFDVLGLIFIFYPAGFGALMNISLSGAAVIVPFFAWFRITQKSHLKYLLGSTIIGCFILTISMGFAYITCFYLIAPFLDITGHSMSWYATPSLAIIIYGSASLGVMLATYAILHSFVTLWYMTPVSVGLTVQAYINGVNIFWGLLIWLSIHFGYRFGYGIAVGLFVTLITNTITIMGKYLNSNKAWVIIHFFGQIFVMIWTTFIVNMVIGAFISILGRIGGDKNPDQLIGCLICAGTIVIVSYLLPLIVLFKKPAKYYMFLFFLCFITILLTCFTKIGFPYINEQNFEPRVQRHYVSHTLRTFYDPNGNIRYSDSGYYFRVIDRNTHRTLKGIIQQELIDQLDYRFCRNETYCGIPAINVRQINAGGFWLPGSTPILTHKVQLQKNSIKIISSTEKIYNFTLTENICSVMIIKPNIRAGVNLIDWDLTNVNHHKPLSHATEEQKETGFPVLIQHGLKDRQPFKFSIKLTSKAPFNGTWVDILLITHHWEYQKHFTADFKNLLAKFPEWAFIVPEVANVDGYKF
uniref:FXNA-like protease n=1 Tax=Culicoides sonorensis TaxID=179676 RepID=A0A336LS90_CULSO